MDSSPKYINDNAPNAGLYKELENMKLDKVSFSFMSISMQALDFAFQPIVDINNGTIYGYEATLCHYQKIGFNSSYEIFEKAHRLGLLHRFDLLLRRIAISKFTQLPKTNKTKLFYNIDNRLTTSPDFNKGATKVILKEYDITFSSFCVEISDRAELDQDLAHKTLTHYKNEEYLTVIDEFGSGSSGFNLLKSHQPDLIKIDRAFIQDIAKDKRTKLMLSTITSMAHVLGIFVIVNGVETELEMKTCKEAGCDLIQGSFVSAPSTEISSFKTKYDKIFTSQMRKMPNQENDSDIIIDKIEYRPPLRIDDSMETVFEAFRRNKEITFFPVVDEAGSPMGIIQEKTIKEYTYSPYGKELIANKGTGLNIRRFLSSCSVADIKSSAQSILESFSLSNGSEGIIIVRDFSYLGFLTTASLLHVINQKNLKTAHDSSPLTKLPGNSSISEFVNKALSSNQDACSLIYFDLDNFKAFNDAYGFRQGDRAILLFAELMRKHFKQERAFLGHVGGDDFFIGLWNKDFDAAQADVSSLLSKFKRDVVSFYDQEARDRGYLNGKDRQGNPCQFPLMSCSAAMVNLHPRRPLDHPNHYELDNTIAKLKKEAKASTTHLAIEDF